MGARGPLPLSDEALRARGSTLKRPAPSAASFAAGAPPCPPHLAGEARAEWRRACKELAAAGVLCKVDRAVMSVYCESWGMFVAASAGIADCLAADPSAGLSRALTLGYVKLQKESAAQVLKCAAQLGLSPAARPRVKAQAGPPAKKEGLAKLFNDGAG